MATCLPGMKRWLVCCATGLLFMAGRATAQPPATGPATEPSSRPSQQQLSALWKALGEPDAAVARQAVRALALSPAQSAEFIAARLSAPKGHEGGIRRLIAQLDDPAYADRTKAFWQLLRLECSAKSALEQALKEKTSPEQKDSIDKLLRVCNEPLLSSEVTRRTVRAIWALEAIGDTRCRAVLEQLAAGDKASRVAQLAAAALARMDGKAPQGDYAPKLRYTVRAANPSIKLDTGMSFDVALTNEGLVPVTIYWGDFAYEDMYRFDITREDKSKVLPPRDRLRPPGAALPEKYFRELAPGQSLTYHMFLGPPGGANCQKYFFRVPGKYPVAPAFVVDSSFAANESGMPFRVPGGWSGTLQAEPMTIVVDGDSGVIREGVRIDGKVVDDAGKPIAEAKVLARRVVKSIGGGSSFVIAGRSPNTYIEDVDYAFSDAQGQFSFLRLPPTEGAYTLAASHPTHLHTAVSIALEKDMKKYKALVKMPDGLAVRGTVLGKADKPVWGVRIGGGEGFTYSDAQGRFVLPAQPKTDPISLDLWKMGWVDGTEKVPLEHAADGTCRIRFYHGSEMRFSGQALFADGTEVFFTPLEFRLSDPNGRCIYSRVETDGQGRFAAVLSVPSGGPFRGTVVAMGPPREGYNFPQARWAAAIEGVTLRKYDVKIVFDNRCAIRANVKTSNLLPESFTFRIMCDWLNPQDNNHRTVETLELKSKGGTADFGRLTPGKYRVSVTVKQAEHWNWQKEVTVDVAKDKCIAEITFDIPKLETGHGNITVLGPDGKTPVGTGSIWLGSSASWGNTPIVAGKAQFRDVPAGPIGLEVRAPGMAMKIVRGRIVAGKTVDLGTVVLQRFEDATGLIKGRMLFDDGKPLVGAALVGDAFLKTQVNEDGGYEKRLPAGDGMMVVDLSFALPTPQSLPLEGSKDAGRRGGRETLLVPVKVEPGKTVARDIVYPRKNVGKLTVTWKGDPNTQVAVTATVVLKDFYLVRYDYPHYPVLDNLPKGPTVLTIVSSDGYRGYREVPADKLSEPVVIDPSQVGSLAVQAFRDGKVVKDFRPELRPLPMKWLTAVRDLNSRFHPLSGVALSTAKSAEPERLADGTLVIKNLSPGKWIVEGNSLPAEPQVVEIVAGKRTELKLQASWR